MKKFLFNTLLTLLIVALCSAQCVFAESEMIYVYEETETYIKHMQQLGVFDLYSNGNLFFEDNAPVKRWESAKALVGYLGYSEFATAGNVGSTFYDVPDYYENSAIISSVVELGIMNGTAEGMFEPEKNILRRDFVKALISALGYDWKANGYGGYPSGYLRVANELKLLAGTSGDFNAELQRKDLVRILYNALETPICVETAISKDKIDYEINENVNILSFYHDILIEEDIVYSNNVISLKSNFDAQPDKVLIGNDEVYIENVPNVFNFLGCKVKYYYRYNQKESDKKFLLMLEMTRDDTSVSLSSNDIRYASETLVKASDKDGKIKEYKIATTADVYRNGELVTEDVAEKLQSFSGSIKLIDRDYNKAYDIVIIKDYLYDEVIYTDILNEKVYCSEMSVELDNADIVAIYNQSGVLLPLNEVVPNNIVAIAKSENGKCIEIVVLDNKITVKVSARDDDGIYTEDGVNYPYEKSLKTELEKKIELGKSITIALNLNNEIIRADIEEKLQLGYLIQITEDRVLRKTEAYARILAEDGNVYEYMCDETVYVDDRKVKAENLVSSLKTIKAGLNLASDGETSQVVYYRVNDENLLKELQTADAGNGTLMMKYNSNIQGSVDLQNHGYGSGVFNDAYAISSKVPVFRVPKTNQESYEDKYFMKIAYSDGKSGLIASTSKIHEIESYILEENDVLPAAIVKYDLGTAEIETGASFFLIEDTRRIITEDDDDCLQIEGYYGKERCEFIVDSSVNTDSLNLTPGDVCVLTLDSINRVINLAKVYDYKTKTILGEFAEYSRARDIKLVYIYNAPVGSDFLEAYTQDFERGVPAEDKMILINLVPYKSTKGSVFTFNAETKEGKVGYPEMVLDYLHAPENYSTALLRFESGYISNVIFYQ